MRRFESGSKLHAPFKPYRWDNGNVCDRETPTASAAERRLGAWHDPPARPPPQGVRGTYTYEPCLDADPMPDYENVLTD